MAADTLPVVNVTVTKTTRLHFRWTEEQIEAMLRAEVDRYLGDNYTADQVSKAQIDMTFGSVYAGGIEASAHVEIREGA